MPDRNNTDHEIGQDDIRNWGMDCYNPILIISALLVLILIIGTMISPGAAKQPFDGGKPGALQAAAISVGLPFALMLLCRPRYETQRRRAIRAQWRSMRSA